MNNARRAALQAIRTKVIGLQNDLEALKDEEQEAFDNLPEGLQETERGEKMEAAVETIESAIYAMEETMDFLNDACE